MDELARLGLAIESDQVQTADSRLDAFSESAGRAEKASDALTGGVGRSNSAIGAMLASIDKSVMELVELTRTHQGLAQAVDRGATANIRYSATFTPITRGAETAAAATVKLGTATEAAAVQAKQAGASFETFYHAAQRDFSTQYVAQLGKVSAAQQGAAKGAKLQAAEVLNLTRQLSDVGVTAAMGMNPLMIAIQQGPQIADIFQTAAARGVTAGGVFKEIGSIVGSVLGKAGPFAIGAAVLGGLAVAFVKGQEESAKFANSLVVTGNYAGLTASSYEAMSKRIAASSDSSTSSARKGVEQLASSGQFTGKTIELMVSSAERYSQFTGQSTQEILKGYEEMKGGVTKWAVKHTETYHDLTLAQIDYIAGLERQGKHEQAEAALMQDIHDQIYDKSAPAYGYLESAVRGVGKAASDMWDKLLGIGRTKTLDEQIAYQAQVVKSMDTAYNRQQPGYKADLNAATLGLNILGAFKTGTDKKAADDAEKARKADDAIRAKYDSGAPKVRTDHTAQTFAQDTAALLANAKAAYDVATAYGVSDAAVMVAEAHRKAITDTTKKALGADALLAREQALLASAIADAVLAGAKGTADLVARAAAQRQANDAVSAGTKTAAQAAQAMTDEASNRDLVAAKTAAQVLVTQRGAAVTKLETDALAKATKALDDRKAAQAGVNSEDLRKQLIQGNAANDNALEVLRLEATLIGKGNTARAVALAQLKAMQQLKDMKFDFRTAGPKEFAAAVKFVNGATDVARKGATNTTATDAYNKSLSETVDLLGRIDERGRDAAAGLASSFGTMGKAVGDLTNILSAFGLKQAQIAKERDDLIANANGNAGMIANAEAVASDKSAAAQMKNYGDLAGAVKGFFGEKTVLFKAAQAAEQAFRLYEFAMSVRAMIQHTAETASAAANESAKTAIEVPASLARAGAKTAEGAASMFATLGPLGFAAVAAMIAVMASFGVSKGSSGAAPGATDAADRQKAQGAGSILGDTTAQSESIAKALEIMASNTNKDLEYSNQMLRSLRSIDNQIGTVAAALARSLSAGGSFSTDGLNLGSTTKQGGLLSRAGSAAGGGALGVAGGLAAGSILGAGSVLGGMGLGLQLGSILGPLGAIAGAILGPLLFSAKTTRTVQDQGLQFNAQSLGALMSGGIQGQTYQQLLETTKKSFIGINYSTKNTSSTVNGGLDPDFARQVTQLIGSLRGTVLEGAKVLGIDGAAAVLDAFQIDLGKISFKDLKGDEIEKALEAVFGKLGDDLAAAAIPGLIDLQKVGEGSFETLARVARDYQVLDITLKSVGMTFGAVGLSSLAARENLIDLVGSIDDLVDQTNFFSENFLSDVERMAPIQKAVADEMARLNLQGVVTKDQFKDIVLGLDLTTQAGRDTYAALLAVAPAFLKVSDFAVEGSKATQDALSLVSKARDQENAQLQSTVDSLTSAGNALKTYRDSLYSGPAAMLSPEDQYAATRAALTATIARRDAGDQSAAADLPGVAGAFLDASKSFNASSANYFKDLDLVKTQVGASQSLVAGQISAAQAQLDANNKMVDGIFGTKEAVLSLRDALLAYQGTLAKPGGAAAAFDSATYANDNADLVEAYKAYAAGSNPYGFSAGLDMAGFLKEHYDRTGQYEIANGGRKFAKGAGFDGPVGAASEILNRPTQLNVGQGGEAGPEAIVPLTRTRDGSLGVRASSGDSEGLRSEIAELKGVVSQLSNQLNNIARASMGQQQAIHKEAQKTRIAGNDIAEGTRKATRAAKAA